MVLTLREALKSLCSSNGWSYAVFWKLKSPNRLILTWEDGHYESTKSPGISNISTFTAPDSLLKNWESGGNLVDYGIHNQDGCSMQDQTELLVSKMSQQMHSLGEGIIGGIAFSEKHQWIIVENLLREWSSLGPLNPCSSFEYPDGWQNQLAAGIKTIAFIAAGSYGVVQLGSKHTIMENLDFVKHVKNLFGSVYNLSRPVSQDSVQELLSGRIHGTQLLPGNKSQILLHDISKQPMLKSSSLNLLEQGGDSLSILATSKGIQVESHVFPSSCSNSNFVKSISQFPRLQKKGMQFSGCTPLHSNEHETLLRETGILPSARVIYPLQGMLQAGSSEASNCQSLFNCSRTGNNQLALMEKKLVKELGLQGQTPVHSMNVQSAVNTKFQNNTQSAQEASFLNSNFDVKSNNSNIISHSNVSASFGDKGMLKSVWLDLGAPLTSPLEQTEIPSSVPALQDVLGQTECSISSSVPEVNANQVEQMGRKVEHLAELDSSHPSYKDPIHSSATFQAPLSAVMDRYSTSWGMTSGQHETALQETVSNHVIPSFRDDFISAAFGIESHSWDKDLTVKDVSSLFQDVMVDNLYPGNESCKDLEAPFGVVTTITGECATGFDDAKSLTKGQDNCTNSSVLPAVDELFDVLHPSFKKCKTQDQSIWDDLSLAVSDGSNANFISHSVGVSTNSQCPSGVDILQSFDASMDRGFEGGFYSDRKSEHLLDAVVANICPSVNHSAKENTSSNVTFSGLNGATSLHSPSVKTNSFLSGSLSSSDKSKYVGLSRCGDNTGLKTVQGSFTSGFQGETSTKCTSHNTSFKSQLSSWIEVSKNCKGENLGHCQAKKLDEPVKVNRKRAKPGESTRPRPKDRQQIQDRVKELREIVPNGTKCSIDALLERTIKHMLFLQSVTKHADKLKNSGEQKFDKDVLLGKDNLKGGTSWALEVGGQSMGCPIIVENMSQPRQMLVEMLCEERGLFLEIADIIRGMGLTILKGVMEARTDKIWARFAVEANRDVQRFDILWSLMQLLQQNTKSTTSASSQPSIVTDEGIDGSRAPNVFPRPQLPSNLSIAERL